MHIVWANGGRAQQSMKQGARVLMWDLPCICRNVSNCREFAQGSLGHRAKRAGRVRVLTRTCVPFVVILKITRCEHNDRKVPASLFVPAPQHVVEVRRHQSPQTSTGIEIGSLRTCQSPDGGNQEMLFSGSYQWPKGNKQARLGAGTDLLRHSRTISMKHQRHSSAVKVFDLLHRMIYDCRVGTHFFPESDQMLIALW